MIVSAGESLVSCCGITLPPQEPEVPDPEHRILFEPAEDEWLVRMEHPMTKEHHVSFLAAVSDRGVQLVKLYPEESPEARFKRSRVRLLYASCNRHGLFRVKT